MARIMHISDLHFGRPTVARQVNSLLEAVLDLQPEAVAVSGDLTQRCTDEEFMRAREFLDTIRRTSPTIVVAGNHDIRWLLAGDESSHRSHAYKYSRYYRHISKELNPSLEISGAVISGLNTAHGILREALTSRLRDFGVIGHLREEDLQKAREAFGRADPNAARIIMTHHNPIQGPVSGRHGLANSAEALRAFANLGVEVALCGHDHHDVVHRVETAAPGLIVSAAGTISSRLRAGRPPSFNVVGIQEEFIEITTYTWQPSGSFASCTEHRFFRCFNGEAKQAPLRKER